jgi:hypothetical protein
MAPRGEGLVVDMSPKGEWRYSSDSSFSSSHPWSPVLRYNLLVFEGLTFYLASGTLREQRVSTTEASVPDMS